MPSNRSSQLRLWSLEETETFLQWLETNKQKARTTKIPQLAQEMKAEIQALHKNEEMSVGRITDKFYNMKKQYASTKKLLNSTGHGVDKGTIEGMSSSFFFLA